MNQRMDWKKLLSIKRVSEIGECSTDIPTSSQFCDPRSPFEKDGDQLVFSYPFRRLQDKTQVIPFPSHDFVHTRLTHSLEVASVGRSFGKMAADIILKEDPEYFNSKNISKSDVGALVSAACLAHDIGNPAFGHSGEASISYYFLQNPHIFPWFVSIVPNSYDEASYKISQPINGEFEEATILKEDYLCEKKKVL